MYGQLLAQRLSKLEEEMPSLLSQEKHEVHTLALTSNHQVNDEEVYYQKDH